MEQPLKKKKKLAGQFRSVPWLRHAHFHGRRRIWKRHRRLGAFCDYRAHLRLCCYQRVLPVFRV